MSDLVGSSEDRFSRVVSFNVPPAVKVIQGQGSICVIRVCGAQTAKMSFSGCTG